MGVKEEPEYSDEPEHTDEPEHSDEPEHTDEPEYGDEPGNSDTGSRDMSESQGRDSQLQFKTVDLSYDQREEIIEKIEGVWSCKVCGKTMRQKSDLKRHAETHIE